MRKVVSYEERVEHRLKFAEIVHEYSFYISLVFTVVFFWNLARGSWGWAIVFSLMGICIDLTKKAQLDLAAVTVEKKERQTRKFVAMVLTVFSLLFSLGAALVRADAVVKSDYAAADLTSYDSRITNQQNEYDTQNKLVQSYPLNYTTARKAAQEKAEAALKEVNRLIAERDVAKKAVAGKESSGDMFELMAGFFKVKDPGKFMVLLLMLATGSLELAFWVTNPQYWKQRIQQAQAVKPAIVTAPTPAPRAQPRPAPVVVGEPIKTTPEPAAAPAVEAPRPRPAPKPKAEPALAEKLLVVKTQKEAMKNVQGSLFELD